MELKELRRDMEGDTQMDVTVPPALRSEVGGSSQWALSSNSNRGGQTSTGDVSAANTTSSSEVILGEVRKHKRGFALALAGLILVVGAVAIIWLKFWGHTKAAPFRTMKMTRADYRRQNRQRRHQGLRFDFSRWQVRCV